MIAIIDVDTADYEISPALSPHPTNHISYGPCATSAAGSAAVQQSVYTTPAVALSISISTRSVQLAEDQARQKANQDQLDISRLPENANLEYCSSINVLNNEGQTLAVPSPTQQSLTPEVSTRVPSALSVNGGSSCGTVGGVGSGDVTIYNDQGYGACGWENDTNSEDFFALAGPLFGTYTNDGPQGHKKAFCGRMASIHVNSRSYIGMLTDRSGGCTGQSIDLSQHLFSQSYPNEPPGQGRYHNVPWEFISRPIYSGPG